jgi:hypothetical protein
MWRSPLPDFYHLFLFVILFLVVAGLLVVTGPLVIILTLVVIQVLEMAVELYLPASQGHMSYPTGEFSLQNT